MADRDGALALAKLVAVVAAVFSVVAIVFAAGSIAFATEGGFTLVDVLVAPIVFVFYAAPGLLVVGMASRSRSRLTAAIPLMLGVLLAFLLEGMGITPWHLGKLTSGANEAETRLFVALFFLVWPATLLGGMTWLVLHRRSHAAPPGRRWP